MAQVLAALVGTTGEVQLHTTAISLHVLRPHHSRVTLAMAHLPLVLDVTPMGVEEGVTLTTLGLGVEEQEQEVTIQGVRGPGHPALP